MCTEGAQLDGAWARPPHPNGMEHDRTHKCDIARSPVVSTENRADTAGRGEPLRNAPFGTVNPSAEAYTGSNPVPATPGQAPFRGGLTSFDGFEKCTKVHKAREVNAQVASPRSNGCLLNQPPRSLDRLSAPIASASLFGFTYVWIVNAFDECPSHAEITAIGTPSRCISVPHVCRAS